VFGLGIISLLSGGGTLKRSRHRSVMVALIRLLVFISVYLAYLAHISVTIGQFLREQDIWQWTLTDLFQVVHVDRRSAGESALHCRHVEVVLRCELGKSRREPSQEFWSSWICRALNSPISL
jgi:hypothetical protein